MPSYAQNSLPLRDAFHHHVRLPLKQTCGHDWEASGNGMLDRFQEWANRGQISKDDNKVAVLCSTLLYGCMHFDALTTLMNTLAFRKTVHTQGPVLHVDFGCGPGTAAWAVTNTLQNNDHLTTIGHDHNPYMIELAKGMTSRITNAMPVDVTSAFHSNWIEFKVDVTLRAGSHQKIVLVTANSYFGQTHADISSIVELIDALREHAEYPLFVFGTHPPYNETMITSAWNRIADLQDSQKLYEAHLDIESGNCRGYDDASCWVPWKPEAQLAHVFKVPPSRPTGRNRGHPRSLMAGSHGW